MCIPWYDTVGAIVGVIVLLVCAFVLGMWFMGILMSDK
jgi:hypothetical protein